MAKERAKKDPDKVKKRETIRLSAAHRSLVSRAAEKSGATKAQIYRRAIIKYTTAPPETLAEILSTQ